MNLSDSRLELSDPTPDVHALFAHFDSTLFWSALSHRVAVKWSRRMYCNAGICWHDRGGGLCDIVLSEPLLKLRSRKNLLETLLHEMIHAFVFLTDMELDRDYHGPSFQEHMHRINRLTGLNISIQHDYHEEVDLYTYWWRCDGPCQDVAPDFGIIRKIVNRAPGPSNRWWKEHETKCGGTFIKIKSPEKWRSKNISIGTKGVDKIRSRRSTRLNQIVLSGTDIITDSNTGRPEIQTSNPRKRKSDPNQTPAAKLKKTKSFKIASEL